MIRNTWRSGEHLVACDRCGSTFYSSQTRKEWTGALVCYGPGTRHCWEPRHPVDFIRSGRDMHGVQDARTRKVEDASVTNVILYWSPDYVDDSGLDEPYVGKVIG